MYARPRNSAPRRPECTVPTVHSRIWGRKIVLEDLSKIGMLAQLAARSRQVDATGEVVEDEGGEGAAIVVDDNFAVGSLNTSCESSMI